MNAIIKELFGGNTVLIGVFIIFLYRAHKEAMSEIRELTKSLTTLTTTMAIHGKELKFVKETARTNKEDIRTIGKDLHTLKNTVITREQMDTILSKL